MIALAVTLVVASAVILLGAKPQLKEPALNWCTSTRPAATKRQLRRAYRRQRADLRRMRKR